MKKFFLLGMIFLPLCITSCGNNPIPDDEPDPEMLAQLAEYATFLSDNYKQGDVLTFETENSEPEIFRIETSYTLTAVCTDKVIDDGGDENFEETDTTHDVECTPAYTTGSYLVSRPSDPKQFDINLLTKIGVYIHLVAKDKIQPQLEIKCYRELSSDTSVGLPAPPQPNTDQLLLEDKGGWCLLERNVGIVQMADTLGHTWRLK